VFEWDAANASHIAEHNVTPDEAEEALTDPHRRPAMAYSSAGERRRAIIGQTESGRVLFVVFTRRGRLMRVITARTAESRERRSYRR
jgi:uncharacterized protein